jgi:hypothetical protein
MTGARPDPTVSNNRYRLLDREVLANPYPVYHQMRSADPVYRERRFGWVLTRYDDVACALRAPHLSAHRPLPHEPVPQPLATVADEVRALRRFQSLWMLYSDPRSTPGCVRWSGRRSHHASWKACAFGFSKSSTD